MHVSVALAVCRHAPHNEGVSIFGPKPGVWWVASKKDPRWNADGRSDAILISAGCPPEAERHIERARKRLGPPPDDLEYGACKD